MLTNKNTLITSSGVIRNRFKPRTGIVSAYSLYSELFEDCVNRGIDLSFESYHEERIAELKDENPELDDSYIDELFERESDCLEFDSRVFLLGAWVKVDGKYKIDRSGKHGDYALTYNTENGIVCVDWSLETTPCNNTSPCYVMSDGSGPCGDLDIEGDAVIAYTLPADMFSKDRS